MEFNSGFKGLRYIINYDPRTNIRIVSWNCNVIDHCVIWRFYGDVYHVYCLKGCYAVNFGDGGKYIRLFIISFVNNSVAARHEAWALISATRVKYKMCGGDEGTEFFFF
jgi:hypothetical protein